MLDVIPRKIKTGVLMKQALVLTAVAGPDPITDMVSLLLLPSVNPLQI